MYIKRRRIIVKGRNLLRATKFGKAIIAHDLKDPSAQIYKCRSKDLGDQSLVAAPSFELALKHQHGEEPPRDI